MGLFLSMSGVASDDRGTIEDALRSYAVSHQGHFERLQKSAEFPDAMVIANSGTGSTTVLYPGEFFSWDEATKHLSQSLQVPVFSFHIHDDDLWMYILFANGEEVDWFNPIPDYWIEDISDDEVQQWAGNASVVAKVWPSVSKAAITNYLARWDLDADDSVKAYSDDEFCFNDCWQLVDFMRKLGLVFPLDERGAPHGETYHFECEDIE